MNESTSGGGFARLRRDLGSRVAEGAFEGLSALGRLHPTARAELARVDVERDVAYDAARDPRLTLDVWRPRGAVGPLPAVVYVHGGGFRILSKETHWIMALAFARAGYVVFNVDYRLAPAHPYPAALEDACAALVFAHEQAARFGADPDSLVLAGESAGANLVTSLAIASSYRRPEPFARRVFDRGVRPRAVVAKCGMLEVGNLARFDARRLPVWLRDRLDEVSEAYLGGATHHDEGGVELANPVNVLENGATPERPLPPFFASVGTRDPLLDDTRRLGAALEKLGVRSEVHVYPGEVHAFQAFLWRRAARDHWRRAHAFVASTLEG